MLAFPVVPLYLDPLKTTITEHHLCAKHNRAWRGAEREQWVRPSWWPLGTGWSCDAVAGPQGWKRSVLFALWVCAGLGIACTFNFCSFPAGNWIWTRKAVGQMCAVLSKLKTVCRRLPRKQEPANTRWPSRSPVPPRCTALGCHVHTVQRMVPLRVWSR